MTPPDLTKDFYAHAYSTGWHRGWAAGFACAAVAALVAVFFFFALDTFNKPDQTQVKNESPKRTTGKQ
jgi:hypothetical protein